MLRPLLGTGAWGTRFEPEPKLEPKLRPVQELTYLEQMELQDEQELLELSCLWSLDT